MKNKMKKIILAIKTFLFVGFTTATAQISYNRTVNPEFEKKIDSYLDYTIPTITVDNLLDIKEDVVILDTREKKEYEISHIPGAIYAGYKKFDASVLDNINKDARIVVYCSIGYRSEKIGEKIKNLGYQNTYNLFGSIFEWANEGQPLEDNNGVITNKLHTYNKKWSKWVIEGKVEKVY